MKKSKKVSLLIIAAVAAAAIACLIIVLIHRFNTVTSYSAYKNAQIQYSDASYAFDPKDLNLVMGNCDAYVLGKVIEYKGVGYRNGDNFPMSYFTFKVVKTIKGDIKENSEILLSMDGGITKDGSSFTLIEDDIRIYEGRSYAMGLYVQNDGSVLIANGTAIELNDDSLNDKAEIAKYEKAYENRKTLKQYENDKSEIVSSRVYADQIDEKYLADKITKKVE